MTSSAPHFTARQALALANPYAGNAPPPRLLARIEDLGRGRRMVTILAIDR